MTCEFLNCWLTLLNSNFKNVGHQSWYEMTPLNVLLVTGQQNLFKLKRSDSQGGLPGICSGPQMIHRSLMKHLLIYVQFRLVVHEMSG